MTPASTTFSRALIPSSRLKNWNTKPMCPRRMRARSSSSMCRDTQPGKDDLAAAGRVDAGDQVQERRLATARRAHDGDELTPCQLELDAAERPHWRRLGLEALARPRTSRTSSIGRVDSPRGVVSTRPARREIALLAPPEHARCHGWPPLIHGLASPHLPERTGDEAETDSGCPLRGIRACHRSPRGPRRGSAPPRANRPGGGASQPRRDPTGALWPSWPSAWWDSDSARLWPSTAVRST